MALLGDRRESAAHRRQAGRAAAGARSPRSTRPPKRCWASPPTPTPTTWAARSTRPGAPSTRPTGRPTPNCGCGASVSCSEAMRDHVEELREITIAEVGAPRMLTSMAQLEGPVDDLSFCADTAESYQWTTDLGDRLADGHHDPAHDRARSRRGRRRHHPVELPAPDQPRQARTRAGRGQHRRAQARARHPVVRGGARRAHRRAHRHSRRASSTSSPPATTASVRCCRRTRGWTWCRSPGRRPPAAR